MADEYEGVTLKVKHAQLLFGITAEEMIKEMSNSNWFRVKLDVLKETTWKIIITYRQ